MVQSFLEYLTDPDVRFYLEYSLRLYDQLRLT